MPPPPFPYLVTKQGVDLGLAQRVVRGHELAVDNVVDTLKVVGKEKEEGQVAARHGKVQQQVRQVVLGKRGGEGGGGKKRKKEVERMAAAAQVQRLKQGGRGAACPPSHTPKSR